MFFLVLPSGILVFSLQSGRKELRTGTYLNTYIGSILSVAFCHFMFVAPDSLVPMHTGITVVLVVHLGISLIFSFVEEQPFSLAVRVVLSLQAFAALALNSDLWVPRLAPFTIPLF
ncbi:MAG: hypothetical protein QF473_09095 [Planctomycetota bacterium]|nr:hypothetical protein [Planctomycetota bacterium]